MATKKRTTRKSSPKKVTKKTANKKIEQIEQKGGIQSLPKEDRRKNNGGARTNSGPKPDEERERLVTLKDQAEMHAMEEVDIAVLQDGLAKKVKMTRAHAVLEMLFGEAVKNKNISAAKEYGDRTRGKARQEVDVSGEIATADQYTPQDPALKAASAAYAAAMKQQIIDGSYGE